LVILSTLEVHNVGGVDTEVIRTLVKMSVVCNFDMLTFEVKIEDIIGSVGHVAKKDKFASMATKAPFALARWVD
jgi:hypothetical protein